MPPLTDGPASILVGQPIYGGTNHVADTALPYLIQGERVTGDAIILQPSPHRTVPRCAHFRTCGGCQYQHIDSSFQLQTKSQILQSLLHSAGIQAPTPQTHAAQPYAYRNRMRVRIHNGCVGYNHRNSNTFLPIVECPIVSPLLWKLASALNTTNLPADTAEAEIFATADDSAAQLTLHLDADINTIDRDAPATFRALCTTLAATHPQLIGGGLLVQGPPTPNTSRRVQSRERIQVAQWGQTALHYAVNGRTYTVSRGAFFQVNRFMTGMLVDLVRGGRTGALALDLFAGAGLFSLPLTERFHQVIAVEIGQPAATDLHRLLQSQGPQHRAMPQTTLAFLQSYKPKQTPDLVIMDPPRAGVGADALRALLKLTPPTIVYVSCDPTTFAREARTLIDSRYAVEELHLLDLFPQTFHMETVAVFRRV